MESSEGSDIDVEPMNQADLSDEDIRPDQSQCDPIDKLMSIFDDSDDDGMGPSGDFVGWMGEWTSSPRKFVTRVEKKFKRETGPKIQVPEGATPNEVFSKIFTEELWDRLVTETNCFAEQQRAATTPTTPSHLGKWTLVTVADMKTFIGLCLTMGILQLPTRRDYWRQKKPLFQMKLPDYMSRDRFAQIWRYA